MSKNDHSILANQHIFKSDAALAIIIHILLGHVQNHVQAIHSAARIWRPIMPLKDVQASPLKTTPLKPNPRDKWQHYLGPYTRSTICLLQNTNPKEMIRIIINATRSKKKREGKQLQRA